jgi:peptidoglycan/LPS O-acetylase OafA/YrhL
MPTVPHPVRERLGVINGLRGVAILAVLYHHVASYRTPPGWYAWRWGTFQVLPFSVLSHGALGVNLFFVLSGFVLYLPYGRSQRQFTGTKDFEVFYIHRFNRLFPLFYLSTLAIDVFLLHPDATSGAYWSNLTSLATATFVFSPKTFMPRTNFVLWSLGVEIWFSVLFPFLVCAVTRWGMRAVLAISLSLSWAVRCADVPLHDGRSVNWLNDSVVGRLDDFVVGMAACHYFLERRRQMRPTGGAWIVFGVAMGLFAFELCDYVQLGLTTPWARPFINTFLQAGFFSLLVGLAFAERGLLRGLLTWGPLQLAGMMCYSLYLWHIPVAEALPVVPGRGLQWHVAYLALLVLLSALSYRYIEFGREPNPRKLFRPSV